MPDSPAQIAVFDVDGVLADVRHRPHFVERKPKNWEGFFAAMDEDGPLSAGITMASDLAQSGCSIVYLTGRNESYRALTTQWLARNGLPTGRLVMRPDHDRRPARLFKPQALQRIAQDGSVVTIVDDDLAVVDALRLAGWPVVHATWMTIARLAEQQSLFDAQEVEGRS